MPYAWTAPAPDSAELQLWPHNSLPPAGFAAIVMGFFLFATIPLYWLLGTVVLWGLLPFVLAAVAGLYWGLQRNFRDRSIVEILTLSPDCVRLTRHNPHGEAQDWESEPYWVQVACHEKGGPVPYYVTLRGHGREVEIGSFLSEDERKALFKELQDRVRSCGRT